MVMEESKEKTKDFVRNEVIDKLEFHVGGRYYKLTQYSKLRPLSAMLETSSNVKW